MFTINSWRWTTDPYLVCVYTEQCVYKKCTLSPANINIESRTQNEVQFMDQFNCLVQ